ncbi:aspartate carbamoyltransferase regulatory subunit [uncultured Eubacterium sp.]|uniref:aspartate carbamoyltransferase regulatory subunit n=1 Tax=uncultured Eubacterium sp. TaxID=165185 RepID=UPI0035A668F7
MAILNIDSIENGYVIDHIPAGVGMKIYNNLNLDRLDCQVAIITNAKSSKNRVKDIIKINSLIDLDFDVVAFLAPQATVNVIENSQRTEKKKLTLPLEIKNIVKCTNPNCICNNENIDHIFKLTDTNGTYRCIYCETVAL